MIIERRSFLKGLSALFIAPAIVRASSLMPVHEMMPSVPAWCPDGWIPCDGRKISMKHYPDLARQFSKLRLPLQVPDYGVDGRVRQVISWRDFRRPNGQLMKAGAQYPLVLEA